MNRTLTPTERLQAIVDRCAQFTETAGYREDSNSVWIGPFLAELEKIATFEYPHVQPKLFQSDLTEFALTRKGREATR